MKKGQKTTRRKRKITSSADSIYATIEDVYTQINKVQVTRENSTLIIKDSDVPTIDNILKDAGLPFKKKQNKERVDYNISPGKEVPRTDRLNDIEELPDEIIEEGQVFF